MELFRAYVERRSADHQANLDRKAEIIATITPEAGCVVPIDVFERAGSELAMIQILEELDPIIQDLLGFCENQPEGKNQLSELRLLLKIDDGRAPRDSAQIERQWQIEQRWVEAYLEMQDSKEYRSEDLLSKQIAEGLPAAIQIGPRQVLNHWKDKKKREPWQAKWAKEIEGRAKLFAATTKQPAKDAKAEKKAAAGKPKKSEYRKHNL
ncbi:hypothetical protein PQR70_33740 [Paraburkholderia madseniana]|uniref:hypothetical protein n=1 Tax=Paraburkholderia madseniana TaxID=2599607 RepID=UPI0038B716B6